MSRLRTGRSRTMLDDIYRWFTEGFDTANPEGCQGPARGGEFVMGSKLTRLSEGDDLMSIEDNNKALIRRYFDFLNRKDLPSEKAPSRWNRPEKNYW
jgi:hypothetical protein